MPTQSFHVKVCDQSGVAQSLFDPRLPAEFWARVHAEPNTGCWLWLGEHNPKGYGRFRRQSAHRLTYSAFVGPIPGGLTIDHVRARGCSGPSCVNPAHLEAVTHAENIARGSSAPAVAVRSGMCRRGHLLQGRNVLINKGRDHTSRTCRACHNERCLARRRALRAGGVR